MTVDQSKEILNIAAISSVVVTFASAALSLIWQTSTVQEGRTIKRLTPAGMLAMGVALIALFGSISSELLKEHITFLKDQGDLIAAQQRALQAQQENMWREFMRSRLNETKSDIEADLRATIEGFSDTQMKLISSKQALMRNEVLRAEQIVVANQPMTSLSFRWRFRRYDARERDIISNGSKESSDNAESSQGGVPRVPFRAVDYDSLLPFLRYVGSRLDDDMSPGEGRRIGGDVVVLVSLDEAHNTLLSFGELSVEGDNLTGGLASEAPLPSGFTTSKDIYSDDYPRLSGSSIAWDIDPAGFEKALSRADNGSEPRARLPHILWMAILYNIDQPIFDDGNLAKTNVSGIWPTPYSRSVEVPIERAGLGSRLELEVNREPEAKYVYALKRAYRRSLYDDFGEEIGTRCLSLEFVLVSGPRF